MGRGRTDAAGDENGGAGRTAARRQAISRRPLARAGLLALTGLMQLDVILFGRLRSGPFFALLRKGQPSDTSPSPPGLGGPGGAGAGGAASQP